MLVSEAGTSTASNQDFEDDSTMQSYSNQDEPVIIIGDNDSDNYEDDDSFDRRDAILISSEDEDESDNGADHVIDSNEQADFDSVSSLRNKNGDIIVNMNHSADEPDIILPSTIASVIKPHQVSGVRFLYDNLIESLKSYKTNEGFGCILAHSMGLGKTIQTIALIHIFLKYTPAKKVLIIVPINTLQNWLCEFNTWLPGVSKMIHNNITTGNDNIDNTTVTNASETTDQLPIRKPHVENNQGEEISEEDLESHPNFSRDEHGGTDVNCEEDRQHSFAAENNSDDAKTGSFTNESTRIDVDSRDYEIFLIGDNQKTTLSRAKVVGEWHKYGGVLLLGYEMFRNISVYTPSLCHSVTSAKGKKKKEKAKKSATVIDIEEEEKEMQLLMGMQKALCKPGPDLVICDEGHRIKNHQSNIHHALHRIRTRKRLVLTGYPLQNNLTEYWCMVDFVRPNYLGTRQEFQNLFERPIVNGQCVDSTAADKQLMKARAHVLSSLLKGFVQRRGYSSLKRALPSKQEHVLMVRLSGVQEALYRRFVELMHEGFGEQLNPIKLFAVCSKIWNHPDILYKAMKSDKPKEVGLFDTDEDFDDSENLKSKTATNNSKPNPSSSNLIMEEAFNPFGGDARGILPKITDWAKEIFESHSFREGQFETSGKFILLFEIIRVSLAIGDKILVFSQSLTTLDLIEDILSRTPVMSLAQQPNETLGAMQRTWMKNVDYYRIDGSTPATERERLIDSFNNENNKETKLFMLSTRAGCLGINLIGANRVVVFDVSWNPCHDAQAVCRVFRYGQKKPCYIYRLVSSNTMEKRMYFRQISKQGVSDRVIDERNPIENFSKEEVHKLLTTTWENEPEADYSEELDNFDDPVLKEVCRNCGKIIVTTPFKHESLLEDHQSSKLSRADKKKAERAYNEERQKSSSIFSGPSFLRNQPTFQRPWLAMRPNLNSPFAPSISPSPSLFPQYPMFGNNIVQSASDLQRLRAIMSNYAMAKMKERQTNTATTSFNTAQGIASASANNNIAQQSINIARSTNTTHASIPMRPHDLASISSLRVGLFGQSGFAPVVPQMAIGRINEASSETAQNVVNHNATSSNTFGQNEPAHELSNEDNSRLTTDSTPHTEVICLDTDDEDEART
eukprot:gene6071-6773_t